MAMIKLPNSKFAVTFVSVTSGETLTRYFATSTEAEDYAAKLATQRQKMIDRAVQSPIISKLETAKI